MTTGARCIEPLRTVGRSVGTVGVELALGVDTSDGCCSLVSGALELRGGEDLKDILLDSAAAFDILRNTWLLMIRLLTRLHRIITRLTSPWLDHPR